MVSAGGEFPCGKGQFSPVVDAFLRMGRGFTNISSWGFSSARVNSEVAHRLIFPNEFLEFQAHFRYRKRCCSSAYFRIVLFHYYESQRKAERSCSMRTK